MSARDAIQTEVLSRAFGEAIRGRRVRAAVFTTFTFDPGFFELHVLPLLFEYPFSQIDKLRRVQLDDNLREIDEMAVYYDRSGLAQDAEPAQLDYRRIDVARVTGVFHPKVVLLLVDEPTDDAEPADEPVDPYQSLVVGILSANLTRSGWWENVECAHFEEIRDRDLDDHRCSFRRDLVTLVRRIRDSAPEGEAHAALDRIRDFVLERTQRKTFQNTGSAGAWYTRIFCGQQRQTLAQFCRDMRLDGYEWNLEILSPYFDAHGAAPLDALISVLEPREIRVMLPREVDGTAQVTSDTYEAIAERAAWSSLPPELTTRGRGDGTERVAPRTVHAKVYRLWSPKGREILIAGSSNLTRAGTSDAASGNLEACFAVDVTDRGGPRHWWLTPLDEPPSVFASTSPEEGDGLDAALIDISVRFDWRSRTLAYRLEGKASPLEICEPSGKRLFALDAPVAGEWTDCTDAHARSVEALLPSTSFLLVRHRRGEWRVLVREENMSYRPSLLLQLTPEGILEYWSLLSPEQRAAFLELRIDASLDGLGGDRGERLRARDTLFDRFAGIYHAFGSLRRYVRGALDEERSAEAEARLLGARYDSLPVLLEKCLDQVEGDAVVLYVTFLCARQLRDEISRNYRDFFLERAEPLRRLDALLERGAGMRASIDLGPDAEAFLDWYEDAFLTAVETPTEAA